MELSIEIVALLFCVAIFAGTIDTMAGGGGLITVPALMLSGLPPISALGTNKLQGCLGTGTATYILLKKSKIKWRYIRPLVITAFLGSVAGTVAVQYINQDHLALVIPFVLVSIAVYFLAYNPAKKLKLGVKVRARTFTYAIVPVVGFYDGMFGPATGSFFTLANIAFRKAKLIIATATAKPLNFATNISSFMVFAIYGNVVWHVGLIMMLGQFIGAHLGVYFLFKINPNHLRKLVVLVCIAMLIKYLHSSGWINIF